MSNTMKLCYLLVVTVASLGNAHPFYGNSSDELRPWIRTKAKELMTRDLLGDIQTHTYTLDPHLHVEVMREVIEEQLFKTTADLVLNFVSRQHEDFLYPGYMRILVEIEKRFLGDGLKFSLAYKIKGDIHRGQVASLLNMFPVAVRTIVTAPTVCIKNKGYSEYFYAADIKSDTDRRHVFTWRPKSEAGPAGDWRFEHLEENKFHIVNTHVDEYLYAADSSHNHDAERRRVFTWIPAWARGEPNTKVWAVEMDGEDAFIRNVYYNEYIYAVDGAYYDDDRRRVFSWIPKDRYSCDGPTRQCRWMLSVC